MFSYVFIPITKIKAANFAIFFVFDFFMSWPKSHLSLFEIFNL